MLDNYSHLKERLIEVIDEVSGIDAFHRCPCNELKEKLEKNHFNLVVVGQFKRGKTTFINALLGDEILPTAVVPLTSIVTIIEFGRSLKGTVYFIDGRTKEIPTAQLHEYVTERGNPKNEKGVREVVITYPSQYLKDGVRLIDTPGVGSVYQHNTDVAYEYLPKADAAIFLISVEQPLSQPELEFLRDVREYSNKIFFLQNKADYLSAYELEESISFTKKVLHDEVGYDVEVFPLSARLALEAKRSQSEDLMQRSFLPAFERVLSEFLMEEKGRVLIQSVTNGLLRILSQIEFEIELELKSLKTPVEELKGKIRIFEDKEKEVEQEKEDLDILLSGEVEKIKKEIIDEDLRVFKETLSGALLPEIERVYRGNRGLSARQLQGRLEEFVLNSVKGAYNEWRSREDQKIAKTFEAICTKFMNKINSVIDELLRFSSELFSIPLHLFKAESVWEAKADFYYKFREDPVALEMLTSSITWSLPRFISGKIIFKKAREYLKEMIEMQGGRIRWDFVKRLDRSTLEFRQEMLQRIEHTIRGIRSAIDKGMDEKTRGEDAVKRRAEEITGLRQTIEQTTQRILDIQNAIQPPQTTRQ